MKEQGERPALRPRAVRPPGAATRSPSGCASRSRRHRHRDRRRDEQGQLPRLREGPPRRLRGRHGRSRGMAPSWQKEVDDFPEYYADYFKKYSSTVTPAAADHLHGPDQLRRPGAAADRHRQPEGGGRRLRRRRRLHAVDRARAGSGATSTTTSHEEYLHAVAEAMREEYLGDRRRRVHPAGRRPVPDRHAERPDDGARRSASGRRGSHVEALNHALRDIPTGADPPPHVLRPQPRAAHERHPARSRRCRSCWRSTPAPTASRSPTRGTTTSGASGRTSKLPDGKILIPGLIGHANELRRAPGADRRLHREVRRARRAGERDRRRRLRVLVAGELRARGAPDGRVAEVPGPRRRRRPRHQAALGLTAVPPLRIRELGRQSPQSGRQASEFCVSHPLTDDSDMQAGAERAVAALAASQHGAFGIRQAAERDVTEKDRRVRVERGQWTDRRRRSSGRGRKSETWRQQLMIAVLAYRRRGASNRAPPLSSIGWLPGASRCSWYE